MFFWFFDKRGFRALIKRVLRALNLILENQSRILAKLAHIQNQMGDIRVENRRNYLYFKNSKAGKSGPILYESK